MLTEDLIEQKIKNFPLNEIKETVFLFFEIFRLGSHIFRFFCIFANFLCFWIFLLFAKKLFSRVIRCFIFVVFL